MKVNIYFSLLCIIFLTACGLPKAFEPRIMERYWSFYKTEQYDSLKKFYAPKAELPEEQFAKLFEDLHQLHLQYGKVKEISLKNVSVKSNNEGSQITIGYVVTHEKQALAHQFYLAGPRSEDVLIINHNWDQK